MQLDQNPLVLTVQYSEKEYRQFAMFSIFKGKYYRIRQLLFFVVCPLLSLALTGYGAVTRQHTIWVSFGGIFVLLCLSALHSLYLSPRKYIQNAPLLFETYSTFRFYEQYVEITSMSSLNKGTQQSDYQTFYRLFETRDMFYLYPAPRLAYLISKKRCTPDTCHQLSKLLYAKLGPKKYIRCL